MLWKYSLIDKHQKSVISYPPNCFEKQYLCNVYSNTVLLRDRPYVTQNLLQFSIKNVTSNSSRCVMFWVEFYLKWFIIRQMKSAWKPSELWERQMLTIYRAIRTSIQGSGDGVDSDIWADIPHPNGQWQYLSFFPPSVDLLFQDVCACVCMEWHWELVVTYEFQYQYIRRCSHLDEPLGLSLPDSDWYHLINMQGHRGEGERGDALLLLLIVSIFTDPQIFLDITQRQLTARMLFKVSDCETNLHNSKTKNLSYIMSARIFVVLTSKHFAKIPEILRQQVIKSKARQRGICYPGLYRVTSVIGRSRC